MPLPGPDFLISNWYRGVHSDHQQTQNIITIHWQDTTGEPYQYTV